MENMYARCMHEIYHAEQKWIRDTINFDKSAAIAEFAQRLGVEVFNFAPAQCRPEDVRGYLIPKWWTKYDTVPLHHHDREKWNRAVDDLLNESLSLYLNEYPTLLSQSRDKLRMAAVSKTAAIGSDIPRRIVTDGKHFQFVSGEWENWDDDVDKGPAAELLLKGAVKKPKKRK